MPFGTRRRVRQAFTFTDPILPIRANQKQKLNEISKQGLENTSQREEARPSAKAPVAFTLDRDTGKGVDRPTPIVNKADPSVGNPDAPLLTKQDKAAVHNKAIPSKSSNPKSQPKSSQDKVLQIITDKVKTNIKKVDNKIKSLTKKGLRSQVEAQIKLKEQQLSKLRTLLKKCPTCK